MRILLPMLCIRIYGWNPFAARAVAIIVIVIYLWMNETLISEQTVDAGIIGGNIKKRASEVLALKGTPSLRV